MIKRCYHSISHVCRQLVVTPGKLQEAFVSLECWNFIFFLKDGLWVSAQGEGEGGLHLSGSSFHLVQDPASASSPTAKLTLKATLGNRKRQKCQVPFWLVFTASTQEILLEYPNSLGWDTGLTSPENNKYFKAFVQWISGLYYWITRPVLLQILCPDRHFGVTVTIKEARPFSLIWNHQKFLISGCFVLVFMLFCISRFHLVPEMKMLWEAILVVQLRWQRTKLNPNKKASHILDWHLILIRFLVFLWKFLLCISGNNSHIYPSHWINWILKQKRKKIKKKIYL